MFLPLWRGVIILHFTDLLKDGLWMVVSYLGSQQDVGYFALRFSLLICPEEYKSYITGLAESLLAWCNQMMLEHLSSFVEEGGRRIYTRNSKASKKVRSWRRQKRCRDLFLMPTRRGRPAPLMLLLISLTIILLVHRTNISIYHQLIYMS